MKEHNKDVKENLEKRGSERCKVLPMNSSKIRTLKYCTWSRREREKPRDVAREKEINLRLNKIRGFNKESLLFLQGRRKKIFLMQPVCSLHRNFALNRLEMS